MRLRIGILRMIGVTFTSTLAYCLDSCKLAAKVIAPCEESASASIFARAIRISTCTGEPPWWMGFGGRPTMSYESAPGS